MEPAPENPAQPTEPNEPSFEVVPNPPSNGGWAAMIHIPEFGGKPSLWDLESCLTGQRNHSRNGNKKLATFFGQAADALVAKGARRDPHRSRHQFEAPYHDFLRQ